MATYTQTVTLSSAGTSSIISLDPTAKNTTFTVQLTAASSGDLTVQGMVWAVGSASAPSWVAVSSHFSSSTATPDGAFLSVLTPIAGLRLSSTSFLAGQTATLQALQAVTA